MKKIKLFNVYKISAIALGLAVTLPLMAADTGQINYQARLLDAYGRRVNTTVNLSFNIYDAVTDGNLLWSETQTGVVVRDGVYSVILGSQTPIPASVFAQNNIYLELGINGETMTPRQQITASAYALTARTIMGSNVYENQTSGYLGVGTTNPAVKLDVNGTIQATGIKIPTGATAGYVLASDGSGVGTWQSVGIVVTEHDPIFTNWVQVTFTPATNDLWTAINLRAMQSDVTAATNDMWAGINARVLAATYSAATGELWTAVNARVPLAGGIMTGPLTNNVLFAGNGAGLTNVPESGIVSTSYVRKAGDTMSGALIISNNLTIALTNEAGATNYISLGGMPISNWNEVTGGNLTNDLYKLQGATGTLNIAVGSLNVSTGALQTNITLQATQVGSISQHVDLVQSAQTAISQHVDLVQSAQTAISNTVNLHTTQIGSVSQHVDLVQSAQTAISNTVNLHTTQIGSVSQHVDLIQSAQTAISQHVDLVQSAQTSISNNVNGLNARSNAWDNAVVMKTGGGTIAYSNVYYYQPDGTWAVASAISTSTASGLLGIALGDSITGNGLLLNGHCTNAWGFTAGQIIYLSTNNNQITAIRPTGTNHVVRIVGYALSTTNIYFNPDRTYIEVAGE